LVQGIIINEKLIDNGKAEIFKVHRDDDGWCYSGDGYAIKYDHKKAIEGVTYKLREFEYQYGNDYEVIEKMHIANTYLLSVYQFIRGCEPSFMKRDLGKLHGKTKYEDNLDPKRKVDRIYPPEETDGFYFGVDLGKFIKDKFGVCSIEEVYNGDYLIIMNNNRPIAKDPKSFFKDGFEIMEKEIIIPNINFQISCINYEQFKAIYDVLNSTGEYFSWSIPEYSKDDFYAAKAKYEKEKKKENEQNI